MKRTRILIPDRSKPDHSKDSESDELRKLNQDLLDENASLREKLEKFEAVANAREDRLQVLSFQLKLGFWEWDEVKNCATYYSQELATLFGVELSDLYERYITDEDFLVSIHPEDVEYYLSQLEVIRECRHLPGQNNFFDFRIVRPDGEVRHVREFEYGVVEDNGVVTSSYGAIQDITEYQQALAELRFSEERYSSLVSQLPIGIQEEDYSSIKKVVDKLRYKGVENLREYLESHPKVLREMVSGTRITSVNETLLKIHEAASEQEYLEVETDIDRWWDAEWVEFYAAEINELAGPDKFYEAERVDTRVDGSYFETRSVTTIVRGFEDTWSRVITMYEDITDRKRDQIALLEAKTLAEKASQAKSEFLSSMSHELRTPLNAILGFSQLFEKNKNIDKDLQFNARRINHAGKHLLTLIDEILDLSRIESGEVELSMEPVPLVNVIKDSITWVSAQAKSRQIKIQFDPVLLAGVLVEADAIKLKQVFLNLLTNAVKYNKKGGSVKVNFKKLKNGFVRIGINDTGAGIAKDRLDDLFQPFNRLGAESSGTEGTGIGLVITRKLVRLMNGQLIVESTPGKGSIFWVELQSTHATNTETNVKNITSVVKHQNNLIRPIINLKILVAEDNLINQDLIAAQLKSLGYDADYAVNGAEALELWKIYNYDLLITDVRMPVMDGIELAKQLRSMESGSAQPKPIIAITANALEKDVKRCRKAGINDVIEKPVDLDDLERSLQKWSTQKKTNERQITKIEKNAGSKGIEAVDITVLQKSTGNKVDTHRELLSAYINALPEALESIQIAFAWHNPEQMADHAHKLKSSSRSMGANDLADLCHAIEIASKENRWIEVEATVPKLEKSAQQVEKFVRAFCKTSSSVAGSAADHTLIDEDITDINISVLVVDDDYIMHKVTSLMLNDIGIRKVHSALSGQQGLKIIDDQPETIDVVICDLNMPGMDGVEFTRHLSRRNFPGSLIITSGEDIRILKTVEKLAIEHDLYVLGVMQKPVTPVKLNELLRMLDQVKSEKSIVLLEDFNVNDLSRAIRNGEMDTFFQPKVDVETRRVMGVEALVRWNHPSEGVITPNVFVPLAEENNLIRELTLAVCKQALQHAVKLQLEGFNLNMAINISVDALNDLSWPDEMVTEIETCGLQPSSITFEITESRLMEHIAVALDILSRLSLKRFNLSIDDFGTGYSSMEQLQRIPFTELKIDRAFVRGASEDTSARAILESNVLLAKKLNMKIVAEGVETQEDWDLVAELGCDQVQGYYIARPMSIKKLCNWLKQWQKSEI
jgi:EAL domain-containing protein (putative c-di-GMP-specific phosphodiesterase class I)/signal transduction histidine kinase/DNA-binding NarL/FixJ family response regulator